jgi:hypothetical protein
MLEFLVEQPLPIYLLLFVIVSACLTLWWRNRRGWYVLGALGAFLLGGGIWLLGVYYETANLQMQRHVQEMSAGVKHHDLDRIFAQISESFHLDNLGKAHFRKRCAELMERQDVTDVEAWEFEPGALSGTTRTMTFKVKPHGNFGGGAAFYQCRAEFVRDPDGQWRLQTFQIFNPFVDTHTPLQIPGL